MSGSNVEARLRRLLLVLAAAMCVGTVSELILAGHTGSLVQFIPFGLCGLALVSLLVAWRWPRRATLLGLRAVLVVVATGGLFGIFEHTVENFAFELEIRPAATAASVFWEALRGGSPLLAPGVLVVMACVGLLATYGHPALSGRGTARAI